jgi:hypothetical protein
MRLRDIRRQLGLLGVGLLIATGLATVPAAPATASVPGWRLVSDTEGQVGGEATALVNCGDQWVYGSGFELTGAGSNYVILDELVPSLHTVHAYAVESPIATTLDWQVTVWAVCGDPNGSHRTVSSTSTLDSRNSKGMDATCPDGTALTGTGWEIDGAHGQAMMEAVVPGGFTVTARAHEVEVGGGYYSGNWLLRVWATCVTTPAGLEILGSSTGDHSFTSLVGHRLCSAGNVILGGGFEVDGVVGRLNMTGMQLNDDSIVTPGEHEVWTSAYEMVNDPFNWSRDTDAICADA